MLARNRSRVVVIAVDDVVRRPGAGCSGNGSSLLHERSRHLDDVGIAVERPRRQASRRGQRRALVEGPVNFPHGLLITSSTMSVLEDLPCGSCR